MYVITQTFIVENTRYKPLYYSIMPNPAGISPSWSGDVAHAKKFSQEEAEKVVKTFVNNAQYEYKIQRA